jgi:hypothetical protein
LKRGHSKLREAGRFEINAGQTENLEIIWRTGEAIEQKETWQL